ncbi:LOW QUALITY PROTEIN: uncharacterized protein LOC141531439 [Cotesia typhae]|uniref:LOW QUALITY PROTEIN: uncharacterized protein LOC141531439 n=1 Tax=Cotesia typhae TaxID=2053667 RepID=UPI003D68381D
MLPSTTLIAACEAGTFSIKDEKERVTVATYSNASGTLKLPLVQKSAWMTSALFKKWFEEKFVRVVTGFLAEEGLKKAVLSVDNCTAHPPLTKACGLKKIYDTYIIFALNLRLLSALAFVPTADVHKCYELVTATDFYDAHAEELDDLLKYFEVTWIDKPVITKKKREKSRFDSSMWNCHSSVINGFLRTNNPTEGWHNRLNRGVAVHHATVGVFLKALKDEQVNTELCITQVNTGVNIANRRKEYRDYDERLKRVVTNYDSFSMLSFLRNIVKVIAFKN